MKKRQLGIVALLIASLTAHAAEPLQLFNFHFSTFTFADSLAQHAADSTTSFGKQKIKEVTITTVRRRNTEAAAVQMQKSAPVVMSNVSAQEIQRAQDNHAGEVIRRVPGVSLIEDKFVMVRGLSQRYNNVWINGGAVPSSEADSRAFSFDMIPGSQIDNLVIVKSPTPEYPADFSGGFIQVNTKEIPTRNTADFSLGGNWNSGSAFREFIATNATHRNIGTQEIDLSNVVLDNDWHTKTRRPIGDLKLSASMARRWNFDGNKLGLIGTANYTNEYRAYRNMTNNLFGLYDTSKDQSNYLRRSTDNQYNHNTRLGAMLNLTWLHRSGDHKLELKNMVNHLTNRRYTWRSGFDAQSNQSESAEYYFRRRTIYNGQLAGKHTLADDLIDWSIGYAYADRYLPDRRRYTVNDALETGTIALSNGNDISREFTALNEHIVSAQANDTHTFHFGNQFEPTLKYGLYGEYRTRKYTTREFIYSWNPSDNTLPEDFRRIDMTELLSADRFLGIDGLYLIEQHNMRNNYRGNNALGAAFATLSLPLGRLGIYGGVRYEYNSMELISNTRDDQLSEKSARYTTNDIFPSLSTTFKIDDRNQMRLSYGRSINRPEFREVSPSVYYDFDLVSNVQGNTDLTACHIDNIDLRYEFYPSRGEAISLAAFNKHFNSPIEWTYTVSGGTDLIYSYKNAQSAHSLGIELDIRKDLSFIGLKHFSLSFNGALIHSRVAFPEGTIDENRPMQGQSPYLVNMGLFYKNTARRLNVGLLYNRIGKRIIGVGRSEGTTGSDDIARVPDSYEMPRDVIDLTFSKSFGDHWEVKANVRDLLGQSVTYQQFAEVRTADGSGKTVEQITKLYKPGRNIGVTVRCIF